MIPKHIIQSAIAEYDTLTEFRDEGRMNIATPSQEIINLFVPYIQKAYGKPIKHVGGNFYKHSFSYMPHTDYEKKVGSDINAVLPLWIENNAHLVVFDQLYQGVHPVTWMMHHPHYVLTDSTALLGEMYKYNLKGLTTKPIDDELYEYIDMYPKEYLYGLSGKAYSFEPGNIIIFDNRQPHCTSKYEGTKLGLSLRFKEI